MSQQQLADALGIKRSNIAAYETKNVEPRLSLIGAMADLLKVSMSDLICKDLEEHSLRTFPAVNGAEAGDSKKAERGVFMEPRMAGQLRQQSVDIRAMLEGFRVFYQYKREILVVSDEHQRRLIDSDVENFLIFINHMLQYNDQIIQMLEGMEGADAYSAAAERGERQGSAGA